MQLRHTRVPLHDSLWKTPPRATTPEILRRLWCSISKQFHLDPSSRVTADSDVEKDDRIPPVFQPRAHDLFAVLLRWKGGQPSSTPLQLLAQRGAAVDKMMLERRRKLIDNS